MKRLITLDGFHIDGKNRCVTAVAKLQDKKIKKTKFPVLVHVEGSDHERELVLCRIGQRRMWVNATTGSLYVRRQRGVYSCLSSSFIWAEDARAGAPV